MIRHAATIGGLCLVERHNSHYFNFNSIFLWIMMMMEALHHLRREARGSSRTADVISSARISDSVKKGKTHLRVRLDQPSALPARSLLAAAAERRRVRRLATLAAKQLPPPRSDAASAEEREPARRSPTPPSSCVPLLGCTTALRGSSISSRRTATRLAPVAAGREHAVAAVAPRAGAPLSYSRAAPTRSAGEPQTPSPRRPVR